MGISRRRFLRGSAIIGSGGLIGAAGSSVYAAQHATPATPAATKDMPKTMAKPHAMHAHGDNAVVGTVDNKRNGFDPHDMLTDWDQGRTSTLPDGRTLREYDIVAIDKEIEIAPGVMFPAWTYNGRVPGPTIRATEGDLLRIKFSNAGSHPHTIHFHGIHGASMDGVPHAGQVDPGETFTYEFTAKPFGCHLYHCHSIPLKRHIHKGLYGAFIIDPDPKLHPEHEAVAKSRLLGSEENKRWQEMVMVLNGFDTNFDDENEFYAANTIAFAYAQKPIKVERDRPLRLYIINVTEFDPINSFHLHANFFNFFDHGTTLEPTLKTVDTVMMCQGQRGIYEIDFSEHEPGLYMFHAHQAEFAELGWMSNFEVV